MSERRYQSIKPSHSQSRKALKLCAAARLKLFEGEWAGVYAREARKASFNAPLGDAVVEVTGFVTIASPIHGEKVTAVTTL